MHFGILLTCVVFLSAAPARAQSDRSAPVFVFHTADFWLNLHQFLYVLGRHEAAMPDRTRRATVRAPGDAQRGLASVSSEEQRVWRAAVTFYAKGPSRQDAVFDEPLVNIGQALAHAGRSRSLTPGAVDAPLAKMLEAVAPISQSLVAGAGKGTRDEAFAVILTHINGPQMDEIKRPQMDADSADWV